MVFMSAFDFLCPIHKTPPKELVELARQYHPVAPNPGGGLPIETLAHILDQRDIASDSYLSPRSRKIAAFACRNDKGVPVPYAGLKARATVITAHRCDVRTLTLSGTSPPPFKPRAAEVLLQIKGKAEDLLHRGLPVVAYESVFPAFDWQRFPHRYNFSLLHEENGRAQFLSLTGKRAIHEGDEIVQLALTTLYASNGGKAYPDVSSRPIRCRNIIYPPETRPAGTSAKQLDVLTYA